MSQGTCKLSSEPQARVLKKFLWNDNFFVNRPIYPLIIIQLQDEFKSHFFLRKTARAALCAVLRSSLQYNCQYCVAHQSERFIWINLYLYIYSSKHRIWVLVLRACLNIAEKYLRFEQSNSAIFQKKWIEWIKHCQNRYLKFVFKKKTDINNN